MIRLGDEDQIRTEPQVVRFLQGQADPQYVVRVLEASRVGDLWYEVHEHIELGSINDLTRQEGAKWTPLQVGQMLDRLAGCLEYIHGLSSHGLIHRDLKPSNILLRRREPLALVLADFRRSVFLASSSEMLNIPRFGAYAPPEWATTTAGDWWSVGVIVFELLTGVHPFRLSDGRLMHDDNIQNRLATAVITRDIFDVSQVDDQRYRNLLCGLLTRSPDNRWGLEQVREWQGGGGPTIYDEVARPSSAHCPPFRFCGKSCPDPRSLADEMGRRWNEAGDLITGENFGELVHWLDRHDPDPLSGIQLAIRMCQDKQFRLDRLIAAIIVEMAPDLPPRFRNFPLDRQSLAELAQGAERGGKYECKAIDSLWDSRALIAYAGLPGYAWYAELEDSWRRNVSTALEHAKVRPELYELLAHEREVETKAALLHVLTADDGLECLAREAHEANQSCARTQGWYRSLAGRSVAWDVEPAQRWLTVAAAPFASQQHAELERLATRILEDPNGPMARYLDAIPIERAAAAAVCNEPIRLPAALPPRPDQESPIEQVIALSGLLRVAYYQFQELVGKVTDAATRHRRRLGPSDTALTIPASELEQPLPVRSAIGTAAVFAGTACWIWGHHILDGDLWNLSVIAIAIIDGSLAITWLNYSRVRRVERERIRSLALARQRLASIALARERQAERDRIADDLDALARQMKSVGTKLVDVDSLIEIRELIHELRVSEYPSTIAADVVDFPAWPEPKRDEGRRSSTATSRAPTASATPGLVWSQSPWSLLLCRPRRRRSLSQQLNRLTWMAAIRAMARFIAVALVITAIALLTVWGIDQQKAKIANEQASLEQVARNGSAECFVVADDRGTSQAIVANRRFPCTGVPLGREGIGDYILTVITVEGVPSLEASGLGIWLGCTVAGSGLVPIQSSAEAGVDMRTFVEDLAGSKSDPPLKPVNCEIHTNSGVIRAMQFARSFDVSRRFGS
ncbi:protein kinase domain-containing protein [Amycolatopsis sp. cmx-4-68]|uniref:protein kinase domain-containing protein n=1 Tax=Amycolatopsis sp. cmx-4-68 TaxID=2790938 RepID=UPI00397CD181